MPIAVHPSTQFVDISCGSCDTMLLSSEGFVYIFGSSGDGKMLEETQDVLVPKKINFFDDKRPIRQVSAGIGKHN